MKLIEFVNDNYIFGIGILTVERPFTSRSLFGVFYQRELKELLIDILFININIKIK